MDNIETVFKNGYIETNEMKSISNVNKQYITNNWIYVKNKHTHKEYYIIPSVNNNSQDKMRFDLLKVVCEHQL